MHLRHEIRGENDMSELLRVERLDQLCIWTVQRPEARNAVSAELAGALERALEAAESDPELHALVLTASGDTFISGADLKFLRSATPEARLAQDARVLALTQRLEALSMPVIAALAGAAIGGGTEIALACDLRIAEPHVTFTFKHAAMGVTPGWGGLGRLAATIGRGAAARALFTAQPVPAQEALRIGLIDELAAPGQARERALELARVIAANSPSTVRALKQMLRAAYGEGLPLAEEQRVFHESTRSADHAEALAAFFEKRPARFGGR
jgi:enoyl-CoA hydratase/carnithine racemase